MTCRPGAFAAHTQQAYVAGVARLARFHHKSPDRLSVEDVRAFVVHLCHAANSWSSYNVTICALMFFFHVTVPQHWPVTRIPYAKKESALPVVLSREEVSRFLAAIHSLEYRAMLVTAYATGLRLSEVVALRICDIDNSRGVIHVVKGKDRFVTLSPTLLTLLREYFRAELH